MESLPADLLERLPTDLRELTAEGLLATARDWRRVHHLACRDDVNEFIHYVLRDERTGHRVAQAPFHVEWHRLASENNRVVLWSAVETGKTNQLAVGRILWSLGRDPSLRVAIISNTHGQAEKIVRTIARYIEHSQELRAVFPHLRPSEPWTADRLYVHGASPYSKDPSVQACGVHGNLIGSRLELVILDDVLDYENTRTLALRRDLWDWYHSTVVGRLTANGRVIAVGTAFHPDDLYHRFERHDRWTARRFPVLDDRGQPTWPARWPADRIDARRVEIGSAEFARQMLCRARDDSESRFKREWVEKCLARGDGLHLMHSIDVLPDGAAIFTGVDLGVQSHEHANPTVLFTLLLHRNEDRQVLNVESGRWTGPEIVRRIIDHHRRYGSVVYVENNAAQEFILQFAREHGAIPIRAFTTGRNKAHPEFGIEGLAVEMENGRWIIPNVGGRCTPEVDAWISELLYYDQQEHAGDHLMASWFAREGARRSVSHSAASVRVRVIG